MINMSIDFIVCPDCKGEGEIYCGHCDGSGQEQCYHCNSMYTCTYCDGEGGGDCMTCDGSGEIEVEVEDDEISEVTLFEYYDPDFF
jgi:hypothetical protein